MFELVRLRLAPWQVKLAVGVVLAAAFLLAQIIGGETWDEQVHALGLIWSVDFAREALAGAHPNFHEIPLDLEYYGHVPVVLPTALAATLTHIFELSKPIFLDIFRFALHANAFVWGVLCAFLTHRIVALLTGDRRLAWLAAALLMFYPLWLGQSFFNYKDLATAFFLIWALYGALLAISGSDKDFDRGLLICAIATMLGCGVKLAGGVLALAPWIAIWITALRSPSHVRRHLKMALAALLVGLAVFIITPTAWVDPIGFARGSLAYMSQHRWGSCTVVFGACTGPSQPGWSSGVYLGAWALAQLPLILLVLGAPAAILLAIKGTARDRVLLATLALPLALIVARNSTLYGALRHVLFVFPLLVAVVFVAAHRATALLDLGGLRAWSARVSQGFGIAVAATLALFAIDNVSLFPYNYVYFNEAARPLVNERSFDLDYWGFSLRQADAIADRYAEDQADAAEPNLVTHATGYPDHIVEPFLRSRLRLADASEIQPGETFLRIAIARETIVSSYDTADETCTPVGAVTRHLLFAQPLRLSFVESCIAGPAYRRDPPGYREPRL